LEVQSSVIKGLHAQFEQYDANTEGLGLRVAYEHGKESLERSTNLALKAWNSARYACQFF
jgi:hypothetical protein